MKVNEIKDKYNTKLTFFSIVDDRNVFEDWAKVLTEEALEIFARCASRYDYEDGADNYLTKMDNENRHWTEDQDYDDEPMTQRYTWMEHKGWIRPEYTNGITPKTLEEREMLHDLGLVKCNWYRLTDDGTVMKSWEDEKWY